MTQPTIDPRIEQILNQVEVYQVVASDYGVPAWQALPPASNPAIAFRPNCNQLEPIWQESDTAWMWQREQVYSTPGQQLLTPNLALELQAAGVCVTGSHAVDVPLVSTDEVFAKFTQARSSAVAQLPGSTPTQPAASVEDLAPAIAATGFNPLPLFLMGCVLVVLVVGAKFFLGKPPRPGAPKSKFTAPPLATKTTTTDDDTAIDYDFDL